MGSRTWLVVLQSLCIFSTEGLVHTVETIVNQEPLLTPSDLFDPVPDLLPDIINDLKNYTWVPLQGPQGWKDNPEAIEDIEDATQTSPVSNHPPVPSTPPASVAGENGEDASQPSPLSTPPPVPSTPPASVAPEKPSPRHDFPLDPDPRVVMEPGGAYGHHAASQLVYLNLLKPKILHEVYDGSVIYDLGCADGMNSIELLRGIKEKARNFTMGFVDLPANDWNTTRKTLTPLLDEIDEDESYFPSPINGTQLSAIIKRNGSKGVLVPRSFYAQVAPNNSVNVAFSSTSVQYLSHNNPKNRAERAADDWLSFLWNRAKELVPGGALYVAGLATYYQGSMPGHIWVVMRRVMHEAVYKGLVETDKVRTWQWPGYPRTAEEWKTPFAAAGYASNNQLQLENFQLVTLDSPYWKMAQGNSYKFASLYVPSVMAWIGSYVANSMGTPVRDLLQKRLFQEVRDFPHFFKKDFLQAVMTIRKTHSRQRHLQRREAQIP